MRALITGISGFVGGHLARFLHEKGLSLWASSHQHVRRFPFSVRWIQTDLTKFNETLELIRKSRPDYLFHLAGQAVPRKSWQDPLGTFQGNSTASLHLLEAVLRLAPKTRVVFVSSAQVYGTTFLEKKFVRETNLANPPTPYAGSKLVMELAALHYVKRHRLHVTIARAFNQVGTGQPADYVFSDFCRQVALLEKRKQGPFLEVGNLNLVRDFIHVRDAARAYWFLAKRGKSGEIYNVGLGQGIHLQAVVDFLAKQSRILFKLKMISSRFRRNDFPRLVGSSSKLRRLGWRPQESVWEGLQELLEEWREKV